MSDLDQFPDVPVRDKNPVEAERKHAIAINRLRSSLASVEDRVTLIESILPELVVAGYGGMFTDEDILLTDIPPTWTDITNYDTNSFATNRGVVNNITTGTTQINVEGVWQMNFVLFFTHNEENGSREFELRVMNKTTGIPTTLQFEVGVARNQTASNIGIPFLVEIASDQVGDEFSFQWRCEGIGNAAIQVNTIDWLDWTTSHVGEWVDSAGALTKTAMTRFPMLPPIGSPLKP